MTDHRQITHSPDCWGWGPRHYECAVMEIEALRAKVAKWKRIAAMRAGLHDESEARVKQLAAALKSLHVQVAQDEDLLRQALDALAYWLEHGETPGSHDIIQRTHDALQERLK